MNASEMFAMYTIAVLMFSAVLMPLIYAAVLDGRHNDQQQRRAMARGTTRANQTVSAASQAEVSSSSQVALGTVS
jgi:hypothetical protein